MGRGRPLGWLLTESKGQAGGSERVGEHSLLPSCCLSLTRVLRDEEGWPVTKCGARGWDGAGETEGLASWCHTALQVLQCALCHPVRIILAVNGWSITYLVKVCGVQEVGSKCSPLSPSLLNRGPSVTGLRWAGGGGQISSWTLRLALSSPDLWRVPAVRAKLAAFGNHFFVYTTSWACSAIHKSSWICREF